MELKPLAAVLGDRASAIRSGMVVDGQRYEVHRHHPPLVYGRTMGAHDPEDSVGAALCAVADRTVTGQPCYGFITYRWGAGGPWTRPGWAGRAGSARVLFAAPPTRPGPIQPTNTGRMPNLSARMVPLLEAFCERHLRAAADGVS